MSGANKHSAFIPLGGGNAFIDGIPDKCKHNYIDVVFILGNDEYIPARQVMCPTWEATREYVEHLASQKGTYLAGETTQCCRCGKIYTMHDIIWDSL